MKRNLLRRAPGFVLALGLSALWLIFVIRVWNFGCCIAPPSRAYKVILGANLAYAVSAGLPFMVFFLVWLLPETLKGFFPRYRKWNGAYVCIAALLLAVQTLCMLPAHGRCVEALRAVLGAKVMDIMPQLLLVYLCTIEPLLALILLCGVLKLIRGLAGSGAGELRPQLLQGTKRFVLVLLAALAGCVISVLLLNLLTAYNVLGSALVYAMCFHNAEVRKAAWIALFWAPVMEEIAFRGVICRGLSKYGGRWPAIIISALFFGLWHRNVGQFVYTFVWGLVYGYICLSSGTVFWGMLSHFISNLLSILAFSENPAAVLGTWPGLCALRKWLVELPLWGAWPLLIFCAAAVVLLTAQFRQRDEAKIELR